MPDYRDLKKRLENGEVIVLDGAIGTQLQDMGVPMHPVGWCGPANVTHPGTVELMHERYIKAGADVITTNTFSTIRPKMEGPGTGTAFRSSISRRCGWLKEPGIAPTTTSLSTSLVPCPTTSAIWTTAPAWWETGAKPAGILLQSSEPTTLRWRMYWLRRE